MGDVKEMEALQTKLLKFCAVSEYKQLIEHWKLLDRKCCEVVAAAKQIRLIHGSTRTAIVQKLKRLRNCVNIIEQDDISYMDILATKSNRQEIAPGIMVPAIDVQSEEMIPDTPLYHVKNTGEWAVRINGHLISGRIAELNHSGRHIPCRETAPHDHARCNRWHPGEQWTLSPGSFIYTPRPLAPRNATMRHVGSRSTLKTDAAKISRQELSERYRQTAHDLLVLLAIS